MTAKTSALDNMLDPLLWIGSNTSPPLFSRSGVRDSERIAAKDELINLRALLLSQSREIERLREAREESALDVATKLARQVFAKRGDHSEIHVNEEHLAAMLVLAIERSAIERSAQ